MASSFAPTEQRLDVTCRRHPAFPRHPAVLVRLVRHVQKRVHDEANAVLKPHGISYPEYNLLMMMYGTADNLLNPSQLADASSEKSSNVTRLTSQLVGKGLIARAASEDDRRMVALTLTGKGEALIERLLPDIGAMLLAQTACLGVREQEQLERLLKKMLQGLDADRLPRR